MGAGGWVGWVERGLGRGCGGRLSRRSLGEGCGLGVR